MIICCSQLNAINDENPKVQRPVLWLGPMPDLDRRFMYIAVVITCQLAICTRGHPVHYLFIYIVVVTC